MLRLSDAHENIVETYRKHTGPVTSISLHPGDSTGTHDVRKIFYLLS